MTVIRCADLSLQFTAFLLDHLLHHLEISVQLLQEEVFLTCEHVFQPREVTYRSFNLFGFLVNTISQLVFLLFRLLQHMVYVFDIMAFMVVNHLYFLIRILAIVSKFSIEISWFIYLCLLCLVAVDA